MGKSGLIRSSPITPMELAMQTAEIHAEHQSILARALAWWQERRRVTERWPSSMR